MAEDRITFTGCYAATGVDHAEAVRCVEVAMANLGLDEVPGKTYEVALRAALTAIQSSKRPRGDYSNGGNANACVVGPDGLLHATVRVVDTPYNPYGRL